MANTLEQLRVSGITYDLIDATAIHSLDGYATTGDVTAATAAVVQTIAGYGYQTSGDVENAISGKADTTAVTQSIEAAVSGKADTTAVTNSLAAKYGAVEYDSNLKRINFYADSTTGTVLSYVDATDFIKDGMVDNVEVKTIGVWSEEIEEDAGDYFLPEVENREYKKFKFEFSNTLEDGATVELLNPDASVTFEYADGIWTELTDEGDSVTPCATISQSGNELTFDVRSCGITFIEDVIISNIESSNFYAYSEGTFLAITFNSDAGKEEIDIPLKSIFNPNNYNTKEELDEKFVDRGYFNDTLGVMFNVINGKQNKLSAGTGIAIDAIDNTISVTATTTVDSTITSGSTNPVTSSAIYNALEAKQDTVYVSGTTLIIS